MGCQHRGSRSATEKWIPKPFFDEVSSLLDVPIVMRRWKSAAVGAFPASLGLSTGPTSTAGPESAAEASRRGITAHEGIVEGSVLVGGRVVGTGVGVLDVAGGTR